jgi:alpha-N-arabinofuranosidase
LIMSLPGKEVGVLQRVYLPVQRELTFNGSLWVKHVRGPVEIAISLRRHAHNDKTLALATVQAAATEWTKYTFTLMLQPGQLAPLEPADLTISISDDGRAEIDNVSLNPADAVDGMDPDVLAMARELKSPLVRFGGNFTSAYRWQDSVGPMDRRVSMLNASWGIPEYNTFGTDEFLRFCKAIHARPQVALNLGTGSPEEAASWVRYIDDHWNNGQGGLLWELGNELWGDFQIGYPAQERIAAVTLASSKAVREVDPHARLIATGGDEDFFTGWNAQQLTNPPSTFDFLSTHFVVTDAVQLPHATADFRTMAALALPWGLAERMHAIQKQAAELGHPDSRVAFTEWLMVSDTHTAPHFTNLGGALFAGGFLNMAMRNSDVVSISDMTGILEFGGIWKKREQVYGAPAYWVLREYARTKPHWLMDVVSDSPTYSITHGINRLPEIKDVPYLDCSAAQTEPKDSLILACVNRHLIRPMEAEIDLRAFSISPGTANATTIAGESILSENDEEEPSRVAPVSHSISFQRGKPLHYTFPNASVTVMRIPLKP